MKKITVFALITMMGATAACTSGPAPKGHWIQGANKMPIFVEAKDESHCKMTGLGPGAAGPRGTLGYKYTCSK